MELDRADKLNAMDRRRFLGLVAAAAAVAGLPSVADAERKRSYFFGPWAPRHSGLVTLQRCSAIGGDDGMWIQAILDQAARDGSGLASVPFGTYLIRKTVVVPSGVTLDGGYSEFVPSGIPVTFELGARAGLQKLVIGATGMPDLRT